MKTHIWKFLARRLSLSVISMMVIAAVVAGCAGSAAQPPVSSPVPTGAATGGNAVPLAQATPKSFLSPETEAWLKAAQLGPYAPQTQDWVAIEAAAIQEGKVVVYVPSVVYKAASKLFMQKYPQIQVDIYDLPITSLNQRLREEQKSGVFNADVYLNPDFGEATNEFLPQGYLWNFVPDSVKPRLPAQFQQPLLTRAMSGQIFYYNSELYDKCPISNWWDLTEPEWKGKLVMTDPNTEINGLAVLVMAALHGDDLSKAYAEKYGQSPKLDSDTPNAGYLWLKRIAANEPAQIASQRVVEAVGTKGMKEAPIGLATYFYYYLGIKGQLAIKPCLGLKPVLGTLSHNELVIINRAPHPNAAKLFIRFILEDPGGSKSITQVGQYPTLEGMPSPEGNIPLPEMLKMAWINDLKGIYDNLPKVKDFWIQATTR